MGLPAYKSINHIAINKWNVKFSGDSNISSFLERLEELRIARGVPGRNWWLHYDKHSYHATTRRVCGKKFAIALKVPTNRSPFILPSWKTYFVDFQVCLQAQIALQFIPTIPELIRICKCLEDTYVRTTRFKPPPTNLKNIIEVDLAYRRQMPSIPYAATLNTSAPLNIGAFMPNGAHTTMVEHNLRPPVTCWNCGQFNHLAAACPQPRRLRCYGCNEPDVTIRTCTKCAGNANQRR